MHDRLISKLDHGLGEIFKYDLYLGCAGAVGAIYLSLHDPKMIGALVPVAMGIVGVVIGAVIAGMAVVAAFMDGIFLRKLHKIGKGARRYVTPFAITAALGVLAALILLVARVTVAMGPEWLRVGSAGFAGLFGVWTIASVLPLLSLAIDFVDLKNDASKVPDDVIQDDNVHPIQPRASGHD